MKLVKIIVSFSFLILLTLPVNENSVTAAALPAITAIDVDGGNHIIDTSVISPNGLFTASKYFDSQIYINNASNGKEIARIPGGEAIRFSPDGTKIYVATKNGVEEYDTKTNKLLRSFTTSADNDYTNVLDLLINDAGTMLYYFTKGKESAMIRGDIEVFFIDLIQGKETASILLPYTNTEYYGQNHTFEAIALDNKKNELAVVMEKGVNFYDASSANYIRNVKLVNEYYYDIKKAIYSSNSENLYIIRHNSSEVEVVDSNDFVSKIDFSKWTKENNVGEIEDIAITPDNKYFIVELSNNWKNTSLLFFNANNMRYKFSLGGIKPGKISFSGNGKRLVVNDTVYDTSNLDDYELKRLDIYGESQVILIGESVVWETHGYSVNGGKIRLNQAEVQWGIKDTNIVTQNFGSFIGNKQGVTLITTKYEDLQMSSNLIVVREKFSDIPSSHKYYNEIHFVRALGYTNGFKNNSYNANSYIQRQHVAAMITKTGVKLKTIRNMKKFTDVPTSHPNYSSIKKLYQAGILDGTKNSFYPNNYVTRKQMAKILVDTFKLTEKDGLIKFADIPSSDWIARYASIVVNNGIMQIDNKGKFNGDTYITRGEFASILFNLYFIQK